MSATLIATLAERPKTAPALHPAGVFSAACTPVNDDLTPDHAALAAHCRTLLDEGCDGVALLGTTGEANSFSARERMAMLKASSAPASPPTSCSPGPASPASWKRWS